MNKTIGRLTTYHGNEHRGLRGYQVRIIAVMKNGARDDYDPDAENSYLTDEEEIASLGGVTANDRIEVQPWSKRDKRFSFVSCDPRAIDLDCFKHLSDRTD